MREIKTHQAHEADTAVRVFAVGDPARGGAVPAYDLHLQPAGAPESHVACKLRFQIGVGGSALANGVTDEALLAVVMDRLEGFQADEFPSDHNTKALKHLGFALKALHARTHDRRARGVEGEYRA